VPVFSILKWAAFMKRSSFASSVVTVTIVAAASLVALPPANAVTLRAFPSSEAAYAVGLTDTGSQIYSLDMSQSPLRTTAIDSPASSSVPDENWTYDPVTGVTYGFSGVSFDTIDLSTGTAAPAFTATTPYNGESAGSVASMAISSSGVAYVVVATFSVGSGDTDFTLGTINLTTGVISRIGVLNLPYADGLAEGMDFDPVTGALYLLASTTTNIGFDAAGLLVVNTSTASVKLVANLDFQATQYAPGDFIHFDSTGTLWILNLINNSEMWSVDPSASDISASLQDAGTFTFSGVSAEVTGFVLEPQQPMAPVITTTSEPLPEAVGVPVSYSLSASGRPGPAFTISSGDLPSGTQLLSDGTIEGSPTAAGSYSYTVTAANSIGASSQAYTQQVSAVSRVAGADRYGTSVAAAQEEFASGAAVVFVADGENFPDALSAGPAAAVLGGPVLLTDPGSLPSEVASEIKTLNPKKIVVLGGSQSVSEDVFTKLLSIVPNTVRWSGSDRYATAQTIDQKAFPNGSKTVFLATGNNYPDALTAGAIAASLGDPILLVDGTQSGLDTATASALTTLHASTVDIAGSSGSVSAGIASGLQAAGYTVNRYGGTDRYATAELLNEAFYATSGTNSNSPKPHTLFLATGQNFPDALSAVPWVGGIYHAPLYLAPGTCVPDQVLNAIQGLGATQVTLIGGTSTLNAKVANFAPCNS
jgi:putative cell wall-binding protein